VSHAGGMGETKRVAHLAHTHLIPVAPHNPVGPIMNAMTLHASLAMPNFSVFETVSMDVPWRKELVRETLQFDKGAILAPTAPGLGVELIEEACERFAYQPTNVPLFDGSMNTTGVATGAHTFAADESE
jgi:galactonate dehydratase